MSYEEDPSENMNAEENKLTSEHYEEFTEALSILYVPANIGGRIAFMKSWPAAAPYVFGEELMRFDTEGTDDKDRRAELEEQATENREKLLDIAKTLEDKSVNKGALQTEYVENLVKELGRDLSLLLYSSKFVDKVIPPPPKEEGEDEEGVQSSESPDSDAVAEQPVEEPIQKQGLEKPIADTLQPVEDVQPISVEPSTPEQPPDVPEPEPVKEGEENEKDVPVPDGPIRFEDLKKITDGDDA